jgi:hypothetical protein
VQSPFQTQPGRVLAVRSVLIIRINRRSSSVVISDPPSSSGLYTFVADRLADWSHFRIRLESPQVAIIMPNTWRARPGGSAPSPAHLYPSPSRNTRLP